MFALRFKYLNNLSFSGRFVDIDTTQKLRIWVNIRIYQLIYIVCFNYNFYYIPSKAVIARYVQYTLQHLGIFVKKYKIRVIVDIKLYYGEDLFNFENIETYSNRFFNHIDTLNSIEL